MSQKYTLITKPYILIIMIIQVSISNEKCHHFQNIFARLYEVKQEVSSKDIKENHA